MLGEIPDVLLLTIPKPHKTAQVGVEHADGNSVSTCGNRIQETLLERLPDTVSKSHRLRWVGCPCQILNALIIDRCGFL